MLLQDMVNSAQETIMASGGGDQHKGAGTLEGPNVSALQELVKKVPKAKMLFQYFLDPKRRAMPDTSFPRLKVMIPEAQFSHPELHQIFDALQKAGAGWKKRSRDTQTDYVYFGWLYNMKDVAAAALGKRLPTGKFRAPTWALDHVPEEERKQLVRNTLEINTEKREAPEKILRAAEPMSGIVAEVRSGNVVKVRSVVYGKPVELELDMSRIPPEAIISIKPL